MTSNPNILVLSNPKPTSSTCNLEDKNGCIFLVNVFGRSPPSQIFKTPLAIHRALGADSHNESVTDTNKLVVSVMIVNTEHPQFELMLTKVNSSFSVDEAHIISVNDRYCYEKLFVSSFEYMDLESIYNVMVEGYGGGFEEKHVIYVLQ